MHHHVVPWGTQTCSQMAPQSVQLFLPHTWPLSPHHPITGRLGTRHLRNKPFQRFITRIFCTWCERRSLTQRQVCKNQSLRPLWLWFLLLIGVKWQQRLNNIKGALSLPWRVQWWTRNVCANSRQQLPSVLWHCWLGVRKSIRPVKIDWWCVGVVVCLQQGADCLH